MSGLSTTLNATGFRARITPVIIALAIGFFLGRYTVKWFRDHRNTPTLPSTIIKIIKLGEKGNHLIKDVTLTEFKREVSIEQLNDLRKSVKWGVRTEKIWNDVFQKSTMVICVKHEEQLVGFGSFVGNGRMGTIFDIHVRPKFQKQKIGSLIMNHLVKHIAEGEYASVGLFGWEENKSVLDFYAKFGFKPNPYGMESSSSELKQKI